MLSHTQWMALAEEEYRRIDAMLAGLSADQWMAPTDCAGWSVRDVVAHLSGAAAATASVREQLRQQRIGAREKGDRFQVDAVNDLHVRERAGLDHAELRDQFAELAQRGLRARRRIPRIIRALHFRFPPPVGRATIGLLNDVVYTRDAWMHRIDISRAIGRPVDLTDGHDGHIVADAAHAWMAATNRSGITLTGPAGGTFGTAPATATLDAVEFARALSGRTNLPGVAGDVVLF